MTRSVVAWRRGALLAVVSLVLILLVAILMPSGSAPIPGGFALAAEPDASAPGAPAGGGKDAKPAKIDVNAVPEGARQVQFTTSEGTWMSIDVAPDGRTILFDLLGDIYRLPIEGGTATRVTSGPAYDYAPRFSPDGKTIVFCSDRGGNMNLWLMAADGSGAHALTEETNAVFSSPSWTPDGLYILARKEDTSKAGIPPVEAWMFHRDGGGGIKVIGKDKLHNSSGPVASRDGRYIYLSGRQRHFSYLPQMQDGLWNLFRFDRKNGDLLKLTAPPNGGLRPTLSPDGRRLIYERRDDAETILVLRDLAGGGETILARGLSRDEQEGFAQMDLAPGTAFTPDGKSFLYWRGGAIHRLDLDSRKDVTLPFRADVSLALRPLLRVDTKVGEPSLKARILRWPTLSPDGSLLAFDALGSIWLCDLKDGKAGAPRRLTHRAEREYAPEFSPDGKSLVYVTWSDRDLGHVVKARVGGKGPIEPVRLTRSAGHYINPTWSPKGDRIAVIAGSGAELRGQQPEFEAYYEIRWLPSEPGPGGADPRTIVAVLPGESVRYHPTVAWSSDGERVFYVEKAPAGGGDGEGDDDPKVEDRKSVV